MASCVFDCSVGKLISLEVTYYVWHMQSSKVLISHFKKGKKAEHPACIGGVDVLQAKAQSWRIH